MAATARKPKENSRGRPASRLNSDLLRYLPLVLFLVAATGALLLIIAYFSTILEIRAGEDTRAAVVESQSGGDRHSVALILLGLAALPMAFGGAFGGSRPAMLAVAAIGLVAAAIALIGDLPDVNKVGVFGERYADAAASPKSGFYLETLGAFLLVIAGGASLLLNAPSRAALAAGGAESRQRSRPRPAAATAEAGSSARGGAPRRRRPPPEPDAPPARPRRPRKPDA